MIKKRWVIVGILAFAAVLIMSGDKRRLHDIYETHIAPILGSAGMNPKHTYEGQTDDSLLSDRVIDTD